MKIKFFIYLMAAVAWAACSHKEKHEEASNWKELDSFHTLMAAAFHPLKDSGNVEPATKLMDSLANEAEGWAASPLPEKVNNADMKAKLEKLKTDLRNLSNEIKDGAPEDQIGTVFFNIHEEFHHIMEAWNGGSHEEGEKHEHK
jgi:hypothetical protein